MESLDHVIARVGEFLEEVKELNSENILLTTHAIALKGGLEYLNPAAKGAWWSTFISTCAIFSTEWDGEKFSLPEEEFQIR